LSGLAFERTNLRAVLPEESRWKQWVFQWCVNFPETQNDEEAAGYNNGSYNPGAVPRVNSTALHIDPVSCNLIIMFRILTYRINGHEQNSTGHAKQQQSNIIKLPEQLPFCLMILSMLSGESGWEVKAAEHGESEELESKTPVVRGPPLQWCFSDENVCNEGTQHGRKIGSLVETLKAVSKRYLDVYGRSGFCIPSTISRYLFGTSSCKQEKSISWNPPPMPKRTPLAIMVGMFFAVAPTSAPIHDIAAPRIRK
jgi:hypothetical protein